MKNSADKKRIVLNKLNQLDDGDDIINEVYQMLYPEETVMALSIDELPKDLQTKITGAISDYRSGNYITQGQMKEKVQQWLEP